MPRPLTKWYAMHIVYNNHNLYAATVIFLNKSFLPRKQMSNMSKNQNTRNYHIIVGTIMCLPAANIVQKPTMSACRYTSQNSKPNPLHVGAFCPSDNIVFITNKIVLMKRYLNENYERKAWTKGINGRNVVTNKRFCMTC